MTDILSSITIDNFKTFFARDFKYGTIDGTIYDSDVTRALTEALGYINRRIIPNNLLVSAFYYLTAHFLVINYRMSFANIQSVGQQLVESNSVSGISETYVIPKRFKDSAVVNYCAKSDYGLKYLSYLLPGMIANVGVVSGNPPSITGSVSPYGFIN